MKNILTLIVSLGLVFSINVRAEDEIPAKHLLNFYNWSGMAKLLTNKLTKNVNVTSFLTKLHSKRH